MSGRARGRDRDRGQALIEFAIGITVFLLLFIGTIDLGRGVFMFNGVAQAAREIARETSVHRGAGALGDSPETLAVLATQRNLVPGLADPVYACVDIAGTVQLDTCVAGDWVRVTTSTTFNAALPFLAMLGPVVLSSTSSAEIQ
jgi:Flp pilus assembly protein TadG